MWAMLRHVLLCLLQLKVMCEGVVETVGRLRVGDWSTPFTAHPKLDSTTGRQRLWGVGGGGGGRTSLQR